MRRLRVTDAAGYRALVLNGYGAHPDAFTATVAERRDLPLTGWEARVARDFVVGAWSGERLVGVAGLAEESRPKTSHKATLYGMYVEAAHARQGIGERLVCAVLEQAATREALRVVQLTVTDTNRAALALYARCGFVAYGTEPCAIAVVDGFRAKVHGWLDLAARGTARRTASTHEASHA